MLFLSGDKIYSSSGKTPINLKTLAEYRTYATNRGIGYTDIGICDDMLLQCLYCLIVRNMNSQNTIGAGISNDTAFHNTGEADTFGWLNSKSTGKNNVKVAVCCLGIENLWGNQRVWEDGIIKTANTNYVLMAQYADQYNSNGTGYENVAQATYVVIGHDVHKEIETDVQYGFMGRVAGLPKFIFMPNASTVAASGRSESTYMCDYHYFRANIATISDFAGSWAEASNCGIFKRELSNLADSVWDNCSSRLVYKHVEGGGA